MATVKLPRADGTIYDYPLGPAADFSLTPDPIKSRIGFAAVHVVADPLADLNPTLDVKVDWEATIAYRRYRLRNAPRHHLRVLDEIAGRFDHARNQDHVLWKRMLLERRVFVLVARISELDRQRAGLCLI